MATFGILSTPSISKATTTTFNPNLIITDSEMQDCQAMNRLEISKFLDSKASYLRNFTTEDVSGTKKTAADIIYDAAQTYQINPKYILVTLQKEQSLVTDSDPTQKQLDWAAGYGVCDDCSMSDPKVQKFKGFGKQVDNAAGVIRWYYNNTDSSFVKQKDTPIRIDNTTVTPQSWATAFLYTYTPHLHGNQNFTKIWNDWFTQNFPNDTILKAVGSDEYWLLQDGKRRKFQTMSALLTRSNPKMAVIVPAEELKNYPLGSDIGLPNYSIVYDGSAYYLIDYYTIRPFASKEVVKKLGYNPQEIIDVNSSDISGYKKGSVINIDTVYPTGLIVYLTDLKQYYLLKDNTASPIVSKTVVDANYSSLPKENHTKDFLSKYTVNNNVISFKNGTLLKSEGTYYVVEDGKKRRIPDLKTFLALGYKESNLWSVDAMTAIVIPDGDSISLNSNLASSGIQLLNKEQKISDLFKTTLPAYLVTNYITGEIIAGKSVTTSRPLASLTKILTAYEALNLGFNPQGTVIYDSKKFSVEDNPLKLVNGEKIRNRDLFNAMLVGSINNTARMVAQSTGYNETDFLNKLKTRLDDWNLANTSLSDVTGLSEKNVSSPMDILTIFTNALQESEIKTALGSSKYSFTELLDKNKIKNHDLTNTNLLLTTTNTAYTVLASKTGYIREGGACLAMLIQSKSDKKQYIIITMGDKNYAQRFVEPDKLAKWAATGKYN